MTDLLKSIRDRLERNGGSEKGHEINSKLNKTLGLCGSGTNSQVQAPDKKLTQ